MRSLGVGLSLHHDVAEYTVIIPVICQCHHRDCCCTAGIFFVSFVVEVWEAFSARDIKIAGTVTVFVLPDYAPSGGLW